MQPISTFLVISSEAKRETADRLGKMHCKYTLTPPARPPCSLHTCTLCHTKPTQIVAFTHDCSPDSHSSSSLQSFSSLKWGPVRLYVQKQDSKAKQRICLHTGTIPVMCALMEVYGSKEWLHLTGLQKSDISTQHILEALRQQSV